MVKFACFSSIAAAFSIVVVVVTAACNGFITTVVGPWWPKLFCWGVGHCWCRAIRSHDAHLFQSALFPLPLSSFSLPSLLHACQGAAAALVCFDLCNLASLDKCQVAFPPFFTLHIPVTSLRSFGSANCRNTSQTAALH
jgi:hypothetical protein